MSVFGIILLVGLGCLVVYLAIDTTIFIVKITKQKKQEKLNKENQDTSN